MLKKEHWIAAGEFKRHCIRLLDDVQASRREITIIKRGKPVAKLVPFEEIQSPDTAIESNSR